MTIPASAAGVVLLTAIFSLVPSLVVIVVLTGRQRFAQARENARLREEADRSHAECLRQIQTIAGDLAAAEKNSQASLELLRDGRLGAPVRARALGMLRSGMAADTAAVELGLARNEVRLLEKVAGVLAPRN